MITVQLVYLTRSQMSFRPSDAQPSQTARVENKLSTKFFKKTGKIVIFCYNYFISTAPVLRKLNPNFWVRVELWYKELKVDAIHIRIISNLFLDCLKFMTKWDWQTLHILKELGPFLIFISAVWNRALGPRGHGGSGRIDEKKK